MVNHDLVKPVPSAISHTSQTTGSPTSTSGQASATATSTDATTFNYGTDIIRGVNLGGWFVLEPWITPSIFENTNNSNIVDEYTFGQLQDHDEALSVLQNHWQTWITEHDFVAIKAAGLNHVRLPIGYWSVPLTSADTDYTTSVAPYITGAWPYILSALNWANTYGIHVILDLHGAPGSQNGYDNSGQRGNANWPNNATNIPRTLDVVRFLADKVGGMVNVIELLNEPAGYDGDVDAVIGTYWKGGYSVVRNATGTENQVMIGDAFLGVDSWQAFLTPPEGQGVIMDYHEYQIFNYDQLEYTEDEHINSSCSLLNTLQSYENSNLHTIIGEWSNAITDCAKWLNGRGVGARWDGTYASGQAALGSCDGYTGNMTTFSEDYKTFLRKYWESQVEIGESISGWVFWTWKAEDADEWSYQRGLEGGWIPQDPTDRLYPDICS
ncbi:glycoside hydrolase family 5 protein [Laetiporus sulphureus 93-53]|uniref:Glycoside hydrolase family 5 protein n=1 Tax=Laetiporus sulphureus 93-53 TaxID=1314785 RepID=A0A165EUZ1_9APHY|nr:glycoside hydrolase family 5 protein [Laetiporus sulphureus 93-53]KZT07815.1 glycoside hydrolase family 5 protein [Laetiporus sulphureus 93-53]